MFRFILYTLAALIVSLQTWVVTGEKVIENRTITIGETLVLTSPSFPRCCVQDFAYYIRCPYTSCGLNILFIDVDLPQLSSLEVYDGWSSQSTLLTSAELHDGMWSRPSLIVMSDNASIILNVPVHRQEEDPGFTGVKFQVQAFNMAETEETAAVTSHSGCGSINILPDWKGGEIKLSPGTSNLQPAPKLDCIWILKTPPEYQSVEAFIRFTHTSDVYGILEVRKGVHSDAQMLFYMDAQNGRNVRMQAEEGYNSRSGLFIRLRKPLGLGSLNFMYGLFSRKLENVKHGTCEFKAVDGEVKRGFACSNFKWCIPAGDRCDGIKQCGPKSGEDEDDCTEASSVLPTSPLMPTTQKTPTAAACWYWEKNCPDGSCVMIAGKCPGECWTWERRCPDGQCLLKGLQCPGACRTWETRCPDGSCILGNHCPRFAGLCTDSEKKCDDGRCIDLSRYCEEEECPYSESYRCGDRCYGEEEKCNFEEYCDDGSDESYCGIPSLKGSSFVWIAIAALVASIMGATCIMYNIRKKYQMTKQYEGNPPPPIGGEPSSPSRMGALAECDSIMVDISDSPTMPLTRPQDPPPYAEAMDAAYDPEPPNSIQAANSSGTLPPPYQESPNVCALPPKTG